MDANKESILKSLGLPKDHKKFAIDSTYVKGGDPKNEIRPMGNIKLDGVITIYSILDTNMDILCIKYTEECQHLAVGFTDSMVRLFKTENMSQCAILTDDDLVQTPSPVTAIQHRPVTKQYPVANMITCTYASGLVKCWKYDQPHCVYTIQESRQTYGIMYHHKLDKFITYGDDCKVYLYDEETRTQERVFGGSEIPGQNVNGHTSKVFASRFNRRSNFEFITGGWDDVVHFWDIRQPTSIRHLSGAHMCAEGLDISGRGLRILACSWQKENPLQIFDYDTGMLMDYFDPDSTKNKFYCGNYLSDDFVVCGGTEPHVFRLVDLNRRATMASITNLPGGIYCLDIAQSKAPSLKARVDVKSLPRTAFCSGKKVFQIDFA